jgi:Cof subfamily protein (haloacid dehalogenase superfamily)
MAIFISDIDGTLLNPERTMSDRTISAIRSIHDHGHSFVLCSSRMPSSMRILEALYIGINEPLIAYNGGLVIEADGSVVHDVPLPALDAETIFGVCEELNVHGSFYAGDDWYIWGDDRWSQREINNTGVQPRREFASWYMLEGVVTKNPPHKIMCMGDEAAISEIEMTLSTNDRLVTYRSKDTYLEIANAQCSKGAGVSAILEERGIEAKDSYYFGDNYNDISAFAVVGTSIAVANAKQAVLAAATTTTASHHDDGVAQFLESWLRD